MTSCELPSHEVAVFSTRAPYREEDSHNEDAAAVVIASPNSMLLMVADGVGGYPSGDKASELTVKTIAAQIAERPRDEMRDVILSAIEEANGRLIEGGAGSATTLALVEINNTTVRPYHVGDSVVMMVGQRGKLKLETVSHSPVGYAVEAGILSEAEGFKHEDRHLVSNIVGTPGMHVTMGMPYAMAKFDTLLLATDGLFDNLPRNRIIDTIRHGDLERSANALAKSAWDKMTEPSGNGKPDDLTFVLFRRKRNEN